MRMRSRFVVFTAVALVAAIAIAQQQPYFQTFEVRLHNLEVQVTDANGNPVRGLSREDFIVRENGVDQDVTNFSVYDSSASARLSQRTASVQEEEPAPAPRRFIFFVDNMSLRKPVRTALIRNANALLDQLQPGDLAAIIRPDGQNRMPQPFTTDTAAARKVLADTIDSCRLGFTEFDEYSRQSTNAFTILDAKRGQTLYAYRTGEQVQQRLAQLRALIGSMAGLEGRKVLVLLTDGLPSIPSRVGINSLDQMGLGEERPVTDWGPTGDFNPLIDELGRTAAANGVTIYALEPQIPLASALRAREKSSASNAERVEKTDLEKRMAPIVPDDAYGELMHFRAQTLQSLAEKTGGTWTRGTSTIDDLFQQVVSDVAFSYSLGYRATADTGKPRKVTVLVRNRPDLKVRTRTEVIDRPAEREMGDLVASTLLYPRNVNELHMAVETGKPQRGKSTVYVPVEVVIPLDTLTFLPTQEGGKYAATVDIHHATSGFERSALTSGRQRQTFEISEADYARRREMTYRFKSGVEVWPGKTRIAIGAMDTASHLVGFQTMDVDAR